MTHGRTGRPWERLKKQIKANATNCWRCGKWLDPTLTWPHPHSVTIGHIIALEDGGPAEDPANLAPECPACNMGDGARRTNAKRKGATPPHRWHDPNW
jgi:hypothetical protein